jgi:hypothetical protein
MTSAGGTVGLQSAPTLSQKLWNGYLKTTDTLTTLFPLWCDLVSIHL